MIRRWRTVLIERLGTARRSLKYVLAGVAVFIIALLLFSPILRVREIRVIRGEGRIDLPSVLAVLSPFYNRHLLLVPAHEVSQKVRQVVLDAKDVTVSKRYPSQISVKITLVPIVARVLIEPVQSDPDLGTGSGSTQRGEYLTENGLLVAATPPDGDPIPTIRIVDWGVRPVPVTKLLDPTMLRELRQAEQALAVEFNQNIKMRTVYLRAREFHLDTDKISFWFDERMPIEDQLQRLRTFLTAVKLTDVQNYVDLRLIGRVVYK